MEKNKSHSGNINLSTENLNNMYNQISSIEKKDKKKI